MIRMMIWEESQKGRNLTMAFISFDGSSCLLIHFEICLHFMRIGCHSILLAPLAVNCQLSFFLRSFQKTEVGEIKIRSIETSGTDQAWKP